MIWLFSKTTKAVDYCRPRFFAALRMTQMDVTLRIATGLSEILHCVQNDRKKGGLCHPERSEGSQSCDPASPVIIGGRSSKQPR